MQIKLDLTKIVTEAAGVQPIENVPTDDGGVMLGFRFSDGEYAVKAAKAIGRKLTSLGLTTGWTGARAENTLTIRLGDDGASPPATWLPKSARETGPASERPALLASLQDALKAKGIKSGYFNSGSVTKSTGIVVSDETVQCGLQFAVDEDGELFAKVQKGSGWNTLVLASTDEALKIVENAQTIFRI
jgi:hypothetical protein